MGMRVVYGLDALEPIAPGGVLAIGNFDGVHLGHRRIIRRGAQLARDNGKPFTVMTFDPHPMAVIMPKNAPAKLTPLNEKLLQLSSAGAETVVVIHADERFLSITAEQFVERIVVGRFRPTVVVEGPSFQYGSKRGGNVNTLRDAGVWFGFAVEVVDPVEAVSSSGQHKVVSSSRIRAALADGDAEWAWRALGRPYAIEGRVVEGRGLGRDLGFATANVSPGEFMVPAEGVYAARAFVGGERHLTALSIGSTPTFAGTTTVIEAHLLDFNEDVYGQLMRLELLGWLRPQKKYVSSSELVTQIEKDVAAVRQVALRINEQVNHADRAD